MVAPILYREVEIVNSGTKILEGVLNERNLPTRLAPRGQNPKLELLRNIRTMTITLQDRERKRTPAASDTIYIPNLVTLRLHFLKTHGRVSDCDCLGIECIYGYSYGQAYQLLFGLRPQKLVLLPSVRLASELKLWREVLAPIKILTVIISHHHLDEAIAHSICRYSIQNEWIRLRLIICPWADQMEHRAYIPEESVNMSSTSLPLEMKLLRFVYSLIKCYNTIEVYLIGPRGAQSFESTGHNSLPTKARAADLLHCMDHRYKDYEYDEYDEEDEDDEHKKVDKDDEDDEDDDDGDNDEDDGDGENDEEDHENEDDEDHKDHEDDEDVEDDAENEYDDEESRPEVERVIFKDRKDYLAEGVTDEIDMDELLRWKHAQDWEDEMESYDRYHPLVLAQQRQAVHDLIAHPDVVSEDQLIKEYQGEW